MYRRARLVFLPLGIAVGVVGVTVADPVGTAFTFQGQLKDNGVPLNEPADFRFVLWDALSDGNPIGAMVPANGVAVANGLLTVELDFGASAFGGAARWLEISVRSPAGSGFFTTLDPRQPVTPTPYALYAASGPGSGGFWAASGDDIYKTNAGNIGIGTTVPGSMLEVLTTEDRHGIRSTTPYIPLLVHRAATTGTWPAIHAECDSLYANASSIRAYIMSTSPGSGSAAIRGVNHGTGAAGIGVYGVQDGAGIGVKGEVADANGHAGYFLGRGYFSGNVGIGMTNPQAKLHVANRIRVGQDPTYANVFGELIHDGGGTGFKINANAGGGWADLHFQTDRTTRMFVESGGNVGIGTTSPQAKLHVNGTTRTNVLHITGADLAEKFPVSEEVNPGMVVAIDPNHPGKLCLARGAYNRRVAGVVSGAGDLPTGAILGHLPGSEDAPPVALGGRVWVYCEVGEHPIEPGDLLTTSNTVGHAMKVTDHMRAQGAILGKAMTSLASGRGKVLVLVSLQ